MSAQLFKHPVTIVFEGQYLMSDEASDSFLTMVRGGKVTVNLHMALRKDLHTWSPQLLMALDSLSPDLEAVTLDKLNLVLLNDATLCRVLIETINKYETPLAMELLMADTTTAFNALVVPGEMPECYREPEFSVMWTGSVLYRCAREALPVAERADQLDQVLPQADPPAASRRF